MSSDYTIKFNAELDDSKIKSQIEGLKNQNLDFGSSGSASGKSFGSSFAVAAGNLISSGIEKVASEIGEALSSAFQFGVEAINEMDASMTELIKVSSELYGNADQIAQAYEQIGEAAKNLSATMTEVTDATTTFVKTGMDFTQAEQFAEEAIKIQKTSDDINQSMDTVVSSITAMQAAWDNLGEDASLDFLSDAGDMINGISAQWAIAQNKNF